MTDTLYGNDADDADDAYSPDENDFANMAEVLYTFEERLHAGEEDNYELFGGTPQGRRLDVRGRVYDLCLQVHGERHRRLEQVVPASTVHVSRQYS